MPRAMRLAPTEDTKDDGVTEEAVAEATESGEDRRTSCFDARMLGYMLLGTLAYKSRRVRAWSCKAAGLNNMAVARNS